ncbi:substrate-binding domain-containing protein [Burkholderia alba]|uniref:substrate-binding domain-containing protein n=1 Tax=Burkholderia alba TaxID=2683677 RepID=UPI002B05DF8D|nr:substrate-binding domain-containing protein [Burkholderia alba]
MNARASARGSDTRASAPRHARSDLRHDGIEIALTPVAAPDHPLARKRKIARATLQEHVQIVLTDHRGRTTGRTFSVFARQRILTADLGSKHAMLRAGLGWGFMPHSVVEEDLGIGRLIELNLAEREPRSRSMPLFLIYRSGHPPGPAGQRVVDSLVRAGKKAGGRRPRAKPSVS